MDAITNLDRPRMLDYRGGHLTPFHNEIMRRWYCLGETQGEIGAALGIPPDSVRIVIQRQSRYPSRMRRSAYTPAPKPPKPPAKPVAVFVEVPRDVYRLIAHEARARRMPAADLARAVLAEVCKSNLFKAVLEV